MLLAPDSRRLIFSAEDLHQFDPALAEKFLQAPLDLLPACQSAVSKLAKSIQSSTEDDQQSKMEAPQDLWRKRKEEFSVGVSASSVLRLQVSTAIHSFS